MGNIFCYSRIFLRKGFVDLLFNWKLTEVLWCINRKIKNMLDANCSCFVYGLVCICG